MEDQKGLGEPLIRALAGTVQFFTKITAWETGIIEKLNPKSTKKSTLGSYNSQTPGGENQDDRENRILSLLRSGSYQSYIRQMSGISRKSEFVNSMARRALINSIGPIASTESYPEEDEFGAAEETKDDDQENDEVFSSESPDSSVEQQQSQRQSQDSLKMNAKESPKDSPKTSPIKQQTSVSFKDAGNLRSSLCKRISTPLAGKRLFLTRYYEKPQNRKQLLDLRQIAAIKNRIIRYHREIVLKLICLIYRKIEQSIVSKVI